MVLGKLDMHIQKSEVGLSSYTIYKIKSKWIKSLNIRPVKLLGEEGGKFHEFECNVIIFWIWYPKYRQQKHNRQMYVYVQSCFNHVWLCVTLWTIAWQAPLSKRFSRQEYWSGLPCPLSGNLPDSGIKPVSLRSSALAGGFFTTRANLEVPIGKWNYIKPKNFCAVNWHNHKVKRQPVMRVNICKSYIWKGINFLSI